MDIAALRKLKRKRQKEGLEEESTEDETDQFMPYRDSTHPILSTIKAVIQKSVPIHSDNGEIKRVNQAFIDPIAHKEFKYIALAFDCFTGKYEFPPAPNIKFEFDIAEPVLIEPKRYPPLYEEYKTFFIESNVSKDGGNSGSNQAFYKSLEFYDFIKSSKINGCEYYIINIKHIEEWYKIKEGDSNFEEMSNDELKAMGFDLNMEL